MGKTILGIDIGYDNLKLALVKDGRVKKSATVPMPRSLLREEWNDCVSQSGYER